MVDIVTTAGASVEMAIHRVAYRPKYTATARLRAELPDPELMTDGPYNYFPMRGPKDAVNSFVSVPATASLQEQHAAFWLRNMDPRLQYVNHELWETRSTARRAEG